jgi:hypothetical protein
VNVAFLGLAEMEDAASAFAVDEKGRFRVEALALCFGSVILPFKEHIFGVAVRWPCGSLREAQRRREERERNTEGTERKRFNKRSANYKEERNWWGSSRKKSGSTAPALQSVGLPSRD